MRHVHATFSSQMSQLIIERAMVPVCGGRVDTPWSAIGEIGDTTLPFQVAQSEPSLVGGFRGGLDWRLGAGGEGLTVENLAVSLQLSTDEDTSHHVSESHVSAFCCCRRLLYHLSAKQIPTQTSQRQLLRSTSRR